MATGYNDIIAQGVEGKVSFDEAERLFRVDRMSVRRKNLIFGGVLLLVVLFSLCQGVSVVGLVYSPLDVLGCYAAWIKLNIGSIFVPSLVLEKTAVLEAYPMFYEVTTRFSYTFITVVCGVMLAVSGMLYQNVFRNPIAAPTMLGVSNGISVGQVLLVWVYGTAAAYRTSERYAFCLIGGALVLAVVIIGGKIAGGKRPLNVVDMMLVGTIVSSLLGTVINYVVNYLFTDTYWQAYYNLNNAIDLDASPFSLAVLTVAALITFAPVMAFRFRMNCIAFSDDDMRLFGIDPTALRVVALVCGSVMILVAQTFCGTVSMVSLVVPFIARAVYGSEFRRQMMGNVLIGALLLLVCRDLVSLIPFVGTGVPLGTMVTFVTLPAFCWVMAAAQKQWGDK